MRLGIALNSTHIHLNPGGGNIWYHPSHLTCFSFGQSSSRGGHCSQSCGWVRKPTSGPQAWPRVFLYGFSMKMEFHQCGLLRNYRAHLWKHPARKARDTCYIHELLPPIHPPPISPLNLDSNIWLTYRHHHHKQTKNPHTNESHEITSFPASHDFSSHTILGDKEGQGSHCVASPG